MFATASDYSRTVLQTLLNKRMAIAAVVLPGVAPKQTQAKHLAGIPIQQHRQLVSTEKFAQEHGIHCHHTLDLHNTEIAQTLGDINPDIILITCFPYILPESIINFAKLASLNLHPSLLPRYRGPSPVFWQLQRGETEIGVTLHIVTSEIDRGNIVAQSQQTIRPGMRAEEIDKQLGTAAANLFIKHSIQEPIKDALKNSSPQEHQKASYHQKPQLKDFNLSLEWSAEQAFNFMRGTVEWRTPYTINYCTNNQQKTIQLKSAITYSPTQPYTNTIELNEHEATIRFKSGSLKATVVNQ